MAKLKASSPSPAPSPEVIDNLRGVISDALDRKGWTVYRLTKELGTDHASIYKFLKSGRPISLTSYARCLEVLGLKLKSADEEKR